VAGASSGAGLGWRWDVALSFAGAQRDYVEQVAETLKERGLRCFYDADEQIGLWGKYLAEELPDIYGEQAATVVMFISAEYANREWTRLERRTALARAARERWEYVLPARFDDTPLPGLPSDMVTVDLRVRTPKQFAAMIVDKLATLAVAPTAPADAGGPARSARPARPAQAVRVSEADPRRLGVHAAISVPRVPDEVLPEYVSRDVDADVWAKVTTAEERGGFVLLVGGSSVGKTRSAVEAVKALLPTWWLVHPAGPAETAALAAAPPPRTVVWLDELQRYLDGENGLTGGVVRALLNAPYPPVIIGTLWPDFYAAYTALPASGGTDPHAREREVLDLAVVVRISAAFSPAEQDRARAAATRDPRLRVALKAADYGLTQTLAAAPQLVARWEDAKAASPYGWAVLTAALDVARLGARAPLSTGMLRATAPGYCTSQQLAEAPGDWFEQALGYAAGKLYGAVAALSPAGSHIGQVDGYTVADYLIQHATRERRFARVPASTWDAVLSYIHDPADTVRLARSAMDRQLYRYAIPLSRHAANAGDEHAAYELTWLLAKRRDLEELRTLADTGDAYAAGRLADLLAENGDLGELRTRADAGDWHAAQELAKLLAENGDLDELRTRADADDAYAARNLAELLAKRRDLDELRTRADADDAYAARKLADLLAENGNMDEATQLLHARVDDEDAVFLLACLLAERGDLKKLRALADDGDEDAARNLAELLAKNGDLEELRTRANAGDANAVVLLYDLLAENGDLDELRARADAGDAYAATQLARALAERGNINEAAQILRPLADASVEHADDQLAELLVENGVLEELRTRADAGDRCAAWGLARLLAENGDLEELRTRADAGEVHATRELTDLLHEQLINQGRGKEAEQLRRLGLNPDGSIACA
jgi:hypothetical protein